MTQPKWAAIQPRDGDRVVHCGHEGPAHVWKHEPPIEMTRPDGSKLVALWTMACDPCFVRAEGDPNKVEIRGDATWIGDEPAVRDTRA